MSSETFEREFNIRKITTSILLKIDVNLLITTLVFNKNQC